MVSHVRGEGPVVRAVFEQVTQRHGGVREPVHEQRLQDTLGVVAGPADGGNAAREEKRRHVQRKFFRMHIDAIVLS